MSYHGDLHFGVGCNHTKVRPGGKHLYSKHPFSGALYAVSFVGRVDFNKWVGLGDTLVICLGSLLIIQAVDFHSLAQETLRFIEIKPASVMEDRVDGQNQHPAPVCYDKLSYTYFFPPRPVPYFVKHIIWEKNQSYVHQPIT